MGDDWDLAGIGLTRSLASLFQSPQLISFLPGRVVAEHRERYRVATVEGEYNCEVAGRLRYSATGRADFPAVGDWVAVAPHTDDDAIIHSVLPRQSVIARSATGKPAERQIIATNVDVALIIVALDRDFVVNRIERYLTICRSAGVDPVIVLSKTDLLDQHSVDAARWEVEGRIAGVTILPVSSSSLAGYEELKALIEHGRTYCLLGSSGVGKSTIINTLAGDRVLETGGISSSTNRGRHVTTHRELVLLPEGGCLIDNPGMREVGTADVPEGLEITFNEVVELARQCRFHDCQHATESGCAVQAALRDGSLDQASYENYQKLEKEQAHYQSNIAERRRAQKSLGKTVKQYKKLRPKGR